LQGAGHVLPEKAVQETMTPKFFVPASAEVDANLSTHPMPNIRVLRDIKARKGVQAYELIRRAYLYVARNQTLPSQVRHQAQLQLNTFGRYTRPTTVKNRCHESGRGRGILSEFRLSRVSRLTPWDNGH
jgi:small subunit ribosomal protein S14